MTMFLIWLLKIFGVLWVVGGAFVIRECWRERGLDRAIEKLDELSEELGVGTDDGEEDIPFDPGRTNWLLVGGVLTLVSGLVLVFPFWWGVWVLSGLVLHQSLYAWRQFVLARAAKSPEAANEAAMTPSARNGAMIAVGVWILFSSLVWTGAVK